jgi:8-oxo-dGTP pyrophosphatase MutT (NUDIX family)
MKQTPQAYLITTAERLLDGKGRIEYVTRLTKGKLTRDENPESHFCTMMVPYDPKTKRVFLVHHKKAKSWVFPGGHNESGEMPIDTAIRESGEELGVIHPTFGEPFYMQWLAIFNPNGICREHYDIFFPMPVAEKNIQPDLTEFYGTEWLNVDDAMKRIELNYYKETLRAFRSNVLK